MFLYLDIHKDYGIINVIPISVYDVQRLQGHLQKQPYTVQFMVSGDRSQLLQNFQIAHFRNYVDANFLPYGKSILQGCRKS